jgi:thioredoxin 1
MFNLFKKRIKAKILTQSDVEKIIDNERTGIIFFGAPWCNACKMQKPLINDMANHHKESRVVIGLVDTDHESELSSMFGITALPTIIALRGKQIVFRKSGIMSRRNLEDVFTELEKTRI